MTDESPEYTNLFGDIFKPGCRVFIRIEFNFLAGVFNWSQPFMTTIAGVFNWSMTYHSSSDVPVPYGRVVPGPSVEGEEGVRNYHGEERGGVLFFCSWPKCKIAKCKTGEKRKGVALLASNCGGISGRYNYLDK